MLIFIVRVLYFMVCAGALYNFIKQSTLDLPYSTAISLFLFLLFSGGETIGGTVERMLSHPTLAMHLRQFGSARSG